MGRQRQARARPFSVDHRIIVRTQIQRQGSGAYASRDTGGRPYTGWLCDAASWRARFALKRTNYCFRGKTESVLLSASKWHTMHHASPWIASTKAMTPCDHPTSRSVFLPALRHDQTILLKISAHYGRHAKLSEFFWCRFTFLNTTREVQNATQLWTLRQMEGTLALGHCCGKFGGQSFGGGIVGQLEIVLARHHRRQLSIHHQARHPALAHHSQARLEGLEPCEWLVNVLEPGKETYPPPTGRLGEPVTKVKKSRCCCRVKPLIT